MLKKPIDISLDVLKIAVGTFQERSENYQNSARFFVDPDLLISLIQLKNQVVFGRRGLGKTHLFTTVRDYYVGSFEDKKILPVFIDGRTISVKPELNGMQSNISLLITYRRFLDYILIELENFTKQKITLDKFEKIWPVNKKKEKLKKVDVILKNLKSILRFGEPEIGVGDVVVEQDDKSHKAKTNQISLDAKLIAKLKEMPEFQAGAGFEMKKISSVSIDESLNVLYQGLTLINFVKINEGINEILDILETESLIILLDEWSAIPLNHQPLLAEMIRTTLVSGKKIFIKFGCIPFLTKLSVIKSDGQTIGFPIGEEVFVAADLDNLYNIHTDPEGVCLFLLEILKKRLIDFKPELEKSTMDDFYNFVEQKLFAEGDTLKDLIYSSAGVPRDFLKIFERSVKKANNLPINLKNVRASTHEFFQEEKSILPPESRSRILFENIFNKKCLPQKSYCFLVSQEQSTNRYLQELWNHRLIHKMHSGYFGKTNGVIGTYDVYAIDYGRFVIMSGTKEGKEFLDTMEKFTNEISSSIGAALLVKPVMWLICSKLLQTESIQKRISKTFTTKVKVDSPELEQILKDCSSLVIDDFISNNNSK